MMRLSLILVSSLLVAWPASAEVVVSSSNGFQIRHQATLVIPPAQAFAQFARIGSWWESDHTYSGNAANLSLAPRAGGCFCETLPDGGGVEHMRVAIAIPGERLVLTGSLGPLIYAGTTGVMDVKFEKIAGGTRVAMDYRVAGFATGGAAEMAGVVDQVLGQQMKNFRAFTIASLPNR